MKLKIKDKYIPLEEILTNSKYTCKKCGDSGHLVLRFVPENNSIQVRCGFCNEFKGSVKRE